MTKKRRFGEADGQEGGSTGGPASEQTDRPTKESSDNTEEENTDENDSLEEELRRNQIKLEDIRVRRELKIEEEEVKREIEREKEEQLKDEKQRYHRYYKIKDYKIKDYIFEDDEIKKYLEEKKEKRLPKEFENTIKKTEKKKKKKLKEEEKARVRLNRASIVKTSFDKNDDAKILKFIMKRESIPKEFENRIKEVEEQIKKKEEEKVEKEAKEKVESFIKRYKESDRQKIERQERKIESDRQKSKEELQAAEEVENDFYYSLKPSRDVNVVSKQLGKKIVNDCVNKTYDILALFNTIPDEREDLEQSKIKAETKQAEAEADLAKAEARQADAETRQADAETKGTQSGFGSKSYSEKEQDYSEKEQDYEQKEKKTSSVIERAQELAKKKVEEDTRRVEEQDFSEKVEDEDEEQDEEQKKKAYIKIQSIQRGRKVRKDLEEKKKAAIKIQALQRGRMDRNLKKIYDANTIENKENKEEITYYNSLLDELLRFKYDRNVKDVFFSSINTFYERLNELFISGFINEKRKTSITMSIENFLNKRQHVDKGIITSLLDTIQGIYDTKKKKIKMEQIIEKEQNLIKTNKSRIDLHKDQLDKFNAEFESLNSQKDVLEGESVTVKQKFEKYVEQSIKIKNGIKEQLDKYMEKFGEGELLEDIIEELQYCKSSKNYIYLKDIKTIKNQIDKDSSIKDIITDYESKEDSESKKDSEKNEKKEILYEKLFNILYRFLTNQEKEINIFNKLYTSFTTELRDMNRENKAHNFLSELNLSYYESKSSFKTNLNNIKNKIIMQINDEKKDNLDAIEHTTKFQEDFLSDKPPNEIKKLIASNENITKEIEEQQKKIKELEKQINERENEKKKIQTRFNESLDNVRYDNLNIFKIDDNVFPDEILLLGEIKKKI